MLSIALTQKLMHTQISFVSERNCRTLDANSLPLASLLGDHSLPLTHTHTHRKLHTQFQFQSLLFSSLSGTRSELHENFGPQTRKFEDLLNDQPLKYSLRREGLRLEPIPPLGVIWNRDTTKGRGEDDRGVFSPGPNSRQSLRRDENVVPLKGGSEWRMTHERDFR